MKYVIGNWKMHTAVDEAVSLLGKIQDGIFEQAQGSKAIPTVVVCPPFVSLSALSDILDDRTLKLGAQNCHWADKGAYTGEISPTMLKGVAEFVILGHSERRRMGESDDAIAKKLAGAVRHGLTPVLCVGESEQSDIATDHAGHELTEALSEVDPGSLPHLIVAYEPVWAVGTGSPADGDQIKEVVTHLKQILKDEGCKGADVLYGGGITAESIEQLLGIEQLDGLLVGGASLDSEQFLGIIQSVAKHYG